MKLITVDGNLITLAKYGNFDAITHGCNCFNMMGAGIAPQMNAAFECQKRFALEQKPFEGDIKKLGTIEIHNNPEYRGYKSTGPLYVINSYTQYHPGKALDYAALELCFEKINYYFKGMVVGMPEIGCGIAGGDLKKVKTLIRRRMKDCKAVVIVSFSQSVDSKVKLNF